MNLRIALGADHAGYLLKNELLQHLAQLGYAVQDFGTNSPTSVDYPDFAKAVATVVAQEQFDLGVLVCGSGIGVSIAANKVEGIRSGVAWNEEVGKMLRQHNDANVICFGARFTATHYAKIILDAFLAAEFEGGNHARRLAKLEC